MKTLDDLMKKVLELFPESEVSEDNEGQIIVYTGMRVFPGTNHLVDHDTPEQQLEQQHRSKAINQLITEIALGEHRQVVGCNEAFIELVNERIKLIKEQDKS